MVVEAADLIEVGYIVEAGYIVEVDYTADIEERMGIAEDIQQEKMIGIAVQEPDFVGLVLLAGEGS